MKKVNLILFLCVMGIVAANGQANCGSPAPGDSCYQSPFLCGNYLDNYCGGNFGFTDDSIAGQWYQNAGFIRFSPCSDTVSISVSGSNCTTVGIGLSFALFEGNCPIPGPLFSADVLQNITDTLTFTNLQPDSTYSLLISGMSGSECEFSIQVLEGIGTAAADTLSCSCSDGAIDGPMVLCPGDTGTYVAVLPICFATGGGPIGGNGYSCPPPDICPTQDSLVWNWHIPAGTYFIGDSTGLSIQIGVDSTISNLDTLIMDSIWISWSLIPTVMPDPLIICDCTGSACSGTIPAKQITIKHDIEEHSCTLTCADPQCAINGVIYTSPGTFIDKVDNCLTLLISIDSDFEPPFPPIIEPITICEGETGTLTILNPEPNYFYSWSNGETGLSINVMPNVTTTYFVIVTDLINGCTVVEAVTVTVLPKIIDNLGVVGTISCAQPCIDFQGTSYCNPGIYTKVNGQCGRDTFEITFDKELVEMGVIGELTCNIDCVDFEGQSYCQPGNFMVEDSCSIKQFSIVENLDAPIFSPPLADCLPNNSQFVITFSISGQPPYKINGSPLAGSNYLSGPILNNTQYSFIIEQANGCQTILAGTFDCSGFCINDAGVIGQNLLEGCSGQNTVTAESIIDPIGAPGAVIEYWLMDASGAILQQNSSGEFAFDPNNMSSEETYFIQRVVGEPDSSGHPDLSDPCTDTTTNQPVIFHDLPHSVSTAYAPICVGETNGVISVQLIDGADPVQYAINNGIFSPDMVFDSLSPGDFTVHVLDANGCRGDTAFVLMEADSLGLSIGPDLSISLGDEVTLMANAMSAPVSVSWWSSIGLSQMGGLQWTFEPPQSMQVTCAMIDSIGCMDTTSILISVLTKYKFDMPNAFTPNGDQANDVFKPVYRGNIFKEYHLSVYSRWGERVFETHTPGVGWDGSHSGKPMNSDVYVYVFEYEFATGEKSAMRKELNLLR